MDITALFKACVKTIRTTNKSITMKEQKENIFKKHRDKNLDKPKVIIKKIKELHSLLQENKAAYINVLNYLSTNKTMSEIDRKQIDTLSEEIIKQCRDLIGEFTQDISTLAKNKQVREHYENIVATLNIYLKEASKIYTESKAILVKRVLETHKLSKLETTPSKKLIHDNEVISNSNSKIHEQVKMSQAIQPENELSVEDIQMFEAENEMLYNELNSLSDEVRQVEGKVVHIAELQELFTEKVLQQEKDIERIATTVVGSTEHMRDANEQIRQSIQRNAGLRVWVLFFLLVMSFSLLFLDWYND